MWSGMAKERYYHFNPLASSHKVIERIVGSEDEPKSMYEILETIKKSNPDEYYLKVVQESLESMAREGAAIIGNSPENSKILKSMKVRESATSPGRRSLEKEVFYWKELNRGERRKIIGKIFWEDIKNFFTPPRIRRVNYNTCSSEYIYHQESL
ncbi:hypothetical protein B6U91_00365 [Candidatus Pacearchaeota archaeon ex4484_71]|nr:MAG: hypothetical protein B6U91_00365 [Candidatus Pacearchaeota archaeon ex4484_71]